MEYYEKGRERNGGYGGFLQNPFMKEEILLLLLLLVVVIRGREEENEIFIGFSYFSFGKHCVEN